MPVPFCNPSTALVLEVSELRIGFPGQAPVLNGVSFSIQRGERVGLAGPSGSGKSLTAAAALGLLPGAAEVMGGEILLHPQDDEPLSLVELTEREFESIRGHRIGLVFQEPSSALNPTQRIGKQLDEAARVLMETASVAIRRAAVDGLLHRVNLGKDLQRIRRAYPHELSGGQRQRVLIAMALVGKPDLLIADEPTTALDPDTEIDILDLIDELVLELGLSLLIITHDEKVLNSRTDRVLRLLDGRIAESEPVVPTATAGLGRKKLNGGPGEERVGVEVLRVRNLSAGYDSNTWLPFARPERTDILAGVNLNVRAGEWVAIIGPSGAGKTTFARALTGRGDARYEELAYRGAQPQLIPQDPFGSLNPRHSVGFALREVLATTDAPRKEYEQRVDELLQAVDLDPDTFRNRLPHKLSGGQRQRVAIARALAAGPSVLVADEAVSALDAPLQTGILELFSQLLTQRELGLVFILHDYEICRRYADRTCLLKDGRLQPYQF